MTAYATLPSGQVRCFESMGAFDAYVRTWRESGYSLSWADPRTVTISPKGFI
jgi:hypothetical protein